MRLRVLHSTRYTYPQPARDSHNELRLMSLSDADQTCLDFRVLVAPPAPVFAYDLPTGRVHHFNHRAPHDSLEIVAESLVVTHRRDPFAGLPLGVDEGDFYQREGVRQRYIESPTPTERVPLHPETDRIAQVARRQESVGAASFLVSLTRMLHRAFTYAPGSTHVNTPLLHVLEHKRGVCQDFAHLMLSICRRQGIPARYVSGYLFTGERAADNSLAGDQLDETTISQTEGKLLSGDAMHAWVECLLPDEQWRGFDPTNNLLTNDSYIKVHYGRDYGDVPPVRGIYHGPVQHTLDVFVRVQADREVPPDPRPTRDQGGG